MFFYLAAIWFASGLLTGITSFGGNLLAIPFMSMLFSPKEAIVISCFSGVSMAFILAAIYHRHILWRDCAILLASCVCGLFPGVFILKLASDKLVLILAGLTILGCLAWQFIMARITVDKKGNPLVPGSVLGFLSGVMNGATGMGGPLMAFYALKSGWSKNTALGTLSMVFAAFTLVLLPMQWRLGLFSGDHAGASAWGACWAAAGILASVPLAARVNQKLFHALLSLVIGVSGCVLLMRGLLA